jgi:hypothetical protein
MDELVLRKPDKKPDWIKEKLPENYYRGCASQRPTEEGAISDAVADAMRKILEEVGIRVESEYEKVRSEDGKEYEVRIKSRIKAKAKGTIRGMKEEATYVEKYKRRNNEVNYYYNACVLIRISPDSIENARREIEEYNRELIKEAKEMMDSVRSFEENDRLKALYELLSIEEMLHDVDTPEARALLAKVGSKIQYLKRMLGNDPSEELLEDEGNTGIIENASFIGIDGSDAGRWIDVGTLFRVNVTLKEASYLYILNFDRETGRINLLFPNRFEKKNYLKEGIYPSSEGVYFEAKEPAGLNTFIIIASENRYEFKDDRLDNEELSKFLSFIKRSRYDIKRIDLYIRR